MEEKSEYDKATFDLFKILKAKNGFIVTQNENGSIFTAFKGDIVWLSGVLEIHHRRFMISGMKHADSAQAFKDEVSLAVPATVKKRKKP